MIDLGKYFEIADQINSAVSSFLLKKFGSEKVMVHKKDTHYAIREDKESNEMYEVFLAQSSPEVALYTEEGERNLEKDLVWIVDPIEGTSNYRVGNPFWATQIALLYKREPVLSIVNAPYLRMKFYAKKGLGAFLNNRKITPSPLTELNKAVVDMGRGTKNSDKEWFVQTLARLNMKIRTNRVFGATSLDISMCASGITDAYLNLGSEIYDLLPGSLIMKEAGGVVWNLKGEDWNLDDVGFLAANEVLAKAVLEILL